MTLDVDALETSFDLIAPQGEELVDTFYRRLFAAAPSVRPLFAELAGDAWRPEYERAWSDAFDIVAGAMLEGAAAAA